MTMRDFMTMLLASTVAVTAQVQGAETGMPASAWGLTGEHLATFSTTDASAITVILGARSPLNYNAQAVVLASNRHSASTFAGDLSTINGARFKVVTDGSELAGVALWLRATSGRMWTCNGQFSTNPSESMVNFISFDRSKSTWRPPGIPKEEIDAAWSNDVTNVEALGVQVVQKGLESQTAGISEFRLEADDYVTEAAELTRLESILWPAYSLLTTAALEEEIGQSTDTDRDGMTDLDEIIAGTDPDDENSVFSVRIVRTETGAFLEWPCVDGGSYTLIAVDSIQENLRPVDDNIAPAAVVASGLRPTEDELTAGRMTTAVNATEGAAFFVVQVK